ncbi:hypothetical protein N7486_004845 [Penicillium sp. IBT 16267x]|nr:hypothetical protein N7486_004845 [Penicillium sp. IBT 16267x]
MANDFVSLPTAIETTIPKVVKKRGVPACSDCKSKKKRCTHRGAEVQTEAAPKATPASVPASAMKTRKRRREGTTKVRSVILLHYFTFYLSFTIFSSLPQPPHPSFQRFSNTSKLTTIAMDQTPAPDDAPASPKKVKAEKTATKKAIKANTTATKPKLGEKAKGKGKAVTEADPAVDKEIQGEKNPEPVKRVKLKQATNPSLTDRPPPIPATEDADADATSTPPASPLAASGPMPDHPSDSMMAAARLSVHTVCSRTLEKRLAELQDNFQAAQEAMEAAINSAAAVAETVEMWKEIWAKGQ